MAVVHEVDHVHHDSGSGLGVILGIILLVVVAFLLFYYGLPALRSGFGNTNPQINVPGKVDVNVNK